MAVRDSINMVARGLKDLGLRWAEVRTAWNDEVAAAFEEKNLKEWERDIRSVGAQIETMSAYLAQVRRDCE